MFVRSFLATTLSIILLLYAMPQMESVRWHLFDAEYGMWAAKSELINQSFNRELTVILGDSRIVAAYKPQGGAVINLGLGGGTPVEAYFILNRLVLHNTHIDLLILSFAPPHFEEADAFLGRTVQFHFLENNEFHEIMTEQKGGQVLGHQVRQVEYCHLRLPMCYGTLYRSLLNPGRAEKSQKIFHDTLSSNGWHLFGTETPTKMPVEVGRKNFKPDPTIDAYFNRLISLARIHNIPVVFYVAPLAKGAIANISGSYRSKFLAYLHQRAPEMRIMDEGAIPQEYIGDGNHVNHLGAEFVTHEIDTNIIESRRY